MPVSLARKVSPSAPPAAYSQSGWPERAKRATR